MKLSDYAERDATGLAQMIAAREVSAEEVQRAAREAVEQVNPALNALVGDLFDAPLSCEADGPFRGVPFAIKDLAIHAAGVPTRLGSRLTGPGIPFPHDTELMARFRRAGLAAIGRTATPEFGFNASTEPVAGGPTRNPWDVARAAGGSSGGSAALVAARALPVAHANDGGGSIRIPAGWCGLVGLKPTRGRTPPGPDFDEMLSGLAVEFAVTRTVRDAAALLDAVQGAGVGDKYEIGPPSRPYSKEIGAPPGRLRVAVTTRSWSGSPVDPEHVQAAVAVGRELASLGHVVEEASPPLDWEAFLRSQLTIWTCFVAHGALTLSEALGVPLGPEVLEATTLASVEHARRLTAIDVYNANQLCNTARRAVAAFFQHHDVLLTPTVATPPPPIGYLDANDARLGALGWLEKLFDVIPFTPLFNVTGQPAMSLPLGQTSCGLPIGVQLVGRYGDEATLFQLAAQLEQALPWQQRRPEAVVVR
ncbi:amidase [Sorangium sp. So ce131]|uniref:amidase n=1 Tax=Sorangium sp. So ce131 TaxID=3133282 RepID=UPI003F61E89C